jgi:probable HAF family extracellular repeat protein
MRSKYLGDRDQQLWPITRNATRDGRPHAFLYENGVMQDLGTLGGTDSTGRGINSNGHVTGESIPSGALGAAHAFLYDGTMHDLGTLGGTASYGQDINAHDFVVGYGSTKTLPQSAFL